MRVIGGSGFLWTSTSNVVVTMAGRGYHDTSLDIPIMRAGNPIESRRPDMNLEDCLVCIHELLVANNPTLDSIMISAACTKYSVIIRESHLHRLNIGYIGELSKVTPHFLKQKYREPCVTLLSHGSHGVRKGCS